MKYLLMLLFVSFSNLTYAQTFVERMGSAPATKLDLAMYKLNERISSQIKDMGTVWGLSSGLSYYASEVIEAKNILHIILYTKAPAKNLNLNSCNLGIMEFNKHHDYLTSIKQSFGASELNASDQEVNKNTVVKLVIIESSNSSLMFQCDWPMYSDKVYAVQ